MREAGLVTAVADAEGFDAVVRAYVDAAAARRPAGARAAPRSCCAGSRRLPRDEAFAWTAEVSAALFASDEAREGMTAFLERRRPAWAPPE